MGMFDYMKVSGMAGQFQTKDFDCAMAMLEITPEGRLRVEDFDYEDVPKAERPYPNDDGIMGAMGSIRRVNKRWRDLNYHGTVEFIGGAENSYQGYLAKFTDGGLVGIERLE